VLAGIRDKKDLTDEVEGALKEAIAAFAPNFQPAAEPAPAGAAA
jgi:hypothetical protein